MSAAGPAPEAPDSSSSVMKIDDAAARSALKNFAAMDTDGDGQLSSEEFRTGLGMLGMDQDFAQILFSSFDTDQSGAINRSEFLAAMAVMMNPTDMESQVSMAFDAYDINHDGHLSLDELEQVISAMFGTMCKMGIREPDAEPSAQSAAAELYRHLDADMKGHVTKEDYLRLATNNPEMLKRLGLGNRLRTQSRLRSTLMHDAIGPPRSPGMPVGSLYGVPPAHRPRRRGHGTTVAFGHDNWELVVQMMLAIRLSVGRAMRLAEEASRKGASVKDGAAKGDGADASPPGASTSQTSHDDLTHALDRSMYRDTWNTKIPGNRRGKSTSIDFKDYAPLVFRRIRSLFGTSDRDYMLSLGPEQILGEMLLGSMGSLAELFSEGKSGSFFYFSNDGRYLIKTIPHRELLSLITLLEKYVAHVEAEPYTLLPRFMGAHRIRMPGGRKVHFVVMTNVFSSPRVIHERYDLKGSTHGRSAGADLQQYPDVLRKDLDLRAPFALKPDARSALLAQIASDLNFLRDVYTMDYSLLCGIHYPMRETSVATDGERAYGAAASPEGARRSGAASTEQITVALADAAADGLLGGGGRGGSAESLSKHPSQLTSATTAEHVGSSVELNADAPQSPVGAGAADAGGGNELMPPPPPPGGDASPISPPPSAPTTGARVSTPARASRDPSGRPLRDTPPWADHSDGAMEGAHSGDEPVVYFIGIIDILTAWTCAKSAENAIKTLSHPATPNAHSCVPPHRYADRFEKALRSWID